MVSIKSKIYLARTVFQLGYSYYLSLHLLKHLTKRFPSKGKARTCFPLDYSYLVDLDILYSMFVHNQKVSMKKKLKFHLLNIIPSQKYIIQQGETSTLEKLH